MLKVGRGCAAALVLSLAALMAPAGASAAEPASCSLGGRFFVRSVKAYNVTVNEGYADYTQFKGAEAFVPAQPALTAEWLQRVISYQIAAGECDFGTRDVAVSVLPAGGGFTVRLSGKDDRAAGVILRHAQQLVR